MGMIETGTAIISDCQTWRYTLTRDLGSGAGTAVICGVNPSTADASKDDHTIRKDMGFLRLLGVRHLVKINEFAFRATDVNALKTAADPIGPDNDRHIEQALRDADLHIAAWGPLGKLPPHLRSRWRDVVAIADRVGCRLMCWGTAQDGQPRHPLMLAYSTPLIEWRRPS
jgi:hypothetical protein